jgi:hypothetical protein
VVTANPQRTVGLKDLGIYRNVKIRNRDRLDIEKSGAANVTEFVGESHLIEDAIDPLLNVA